MAEKTLKKSDYIHDKTHLKGFIFPQENFKSIESLRYCLLEIKERWDNRLSAKIAPLVKVMLQVTIASLFMEISVLEATINASSYSSNSIQVQRWFPTNKDVKLSRYLSNRGDKVVVFIEDTKRTLGKHGIVRQMSNERNYL